MKRRNLVKKAIFPAILALLCSVVALTSVSYAWFTMGNTATVNGMELNITTADGLQISTTGSVGTFKSSITAEDLIDVRTNKFPTSARPVSSVGAFENGNQKMFLGEEENFMLTSSPDTNNYIVFDLYIQTSTNYILVLNTGSYVKCASADDEAHLAARVSFVDLGSATLAANVQGDDYLAGKNGTATIWEPNFKERAKFVKDNGIAADTNTALPYYGLMDRFTATKTADVNKEGTTISKKIDSANETNIVTPAYESGVTTEQANLLNLEKDFNRIRVYIWLEGQDVDCVNDIAAGKLQINLNLALKTAQQ